MIYGRIEEMLLSRHWRRQHSAHVCRQLCLNTYNAEWASSLCAEGYPCNGASRQGFTHCQASMPAPTPFTSASIRKRSKMKCTRSAALHITRPPTRKCLGQKKNFKEPKIHQKPIHFMTSLRVIYQFHGETRNGTRPLRPRSVKLAETPVFKDSEHGAEDNVSDRSLLSFRPSRQTKRPYLKLAATPNDVARAVIWQYRAFSGSWSLALLVTTSSCYQWTATSARAWG